MKKYIIIFVIAVVFAAVFVSLCHKKESATQTTYVTLSELNVMDSLFLAQLDSIVIRSPYYSKSGKYSTFTIGFFDNGEDNLSFIVCEKEMHYINEYIDEYYGIFILNNRYEFFVNKTEVPANMFLETGKTRNFRLLPKPQPMIYDPPSWMIMYYKGEMFLLDSIDKTRRL